MSSTSSTSGARPVARAEVLHRRARRAPDRADEVGHELLAGHEGDRPLGVLAVDLVADRLQEVGLAEADAAVDEQRVPARRRGVRHHAGRRVRELVGRSDDELVEGVARDQLGRRRAPPAAAAIARSRRSGRRRGVRPPRPRRSSDHLEVDRERPLRARLQVLEDRGQEIVLEPLLVVAVRRPQADPPVVDAHALDRPQPEVAVRRLHHRFDRADRLGPELKHPDSPVHSPVERNNDPSDFRRVSRDFPLFVHSNRQPPAPERRKVGTTRFLGSCSVSSRMPRAAGRRAVHGSLSNRRRMPTSAQRAAQCASSRKSVR